jgi:hypothetical protein
MGTKLPASMQDIISAEADLDPEYLLRLISRLMMVWDTANVKTSCIDVIRDGKRSRLITLTFDVGTYEQSETTFSIKSSLGGGGTT